MKYTSLIPFFCFFLFINVGFNQNIEKFKDKLEKYRSENWPPEKAHSRISLGYALQKVFEQHAQFCGFKNDNGKRDYVPGDISRFLGKRDLRTKVETADISGGGLLYYIFDASEIQTPFSELRYLPSRVIKLNSISNQFVANPDENFDSFIMTKTCGGYLKASLDAGIEPPYAAFKAAFDTDSRRESSVFALSGSFLSPLKVALDANDYRTMEFLMNLWKFYRDNPAFDGNAYFIKAFEGVMIKHIASAEENAKIERSGCLNINAPLGIRLKSELGLTQTSKNTFSGSDWETIIYSDFDENYTRSSLYAALPSSSEISRYFEKIKPVYQKDKDFPLMTEGFDHTHFLVLEGVPEFMTANFWEIESVKPGIFRGDPRLEANYFSNQNENSWGCQFKVTGKPDPSNFMGPLSNRPSKLELSYVIKSREPVNGQYIRFYVDEEIQTSSHPIAAVNEGEFDLSKKESRRFAFQWKFDIEIEDHYNPVDFNAEPYITNLSVRKSDKDLNVRISEINMDRQRRRISLVLETNDSYPLERIDDSNMINYNMAFDIHLQSERSGSISVRPVKGNLLFPAIRPIEVQPIETKTFLQPIERNKD